MTTLPASWRLPTDPPAGQPHTWTPDVIAVTNFGSLVRVAFVHGDPGTGTGMWQRPDTFRPHEEVAMWCDMPSTADVRLFATIAAGQLAAATEERMEPDGGPWEAGWAQRAGSVGADEVAAMARTLAELRDRLKWQRQADDARCVGSAREWLIEMAAMSEPTAQDRERAWRGRGAEIGVVCDGLDRIAWKRAKAHASSDANSLRFAEMLLRRLYACATTPPFHAAGDVKTFDSTAPILGSA